MELPKNTPDDSTRKTKEKSTPSTPAIQPNNVGDSEAIFYNNDQQTPVYRKGDRSPCGTKDISSLIITGNVPINKICTVNPVFINHNVTFFVDGTKLSHWKDCLSDILGKWKHTKTKAFHYRCENERNGKLEPISQDAFGSPETYHSQRFIYQHKEASDFHRIVMYYFDGAEHAVAPTLTYHETRRNAEQTPYVRSNKSVIEKLKESDNLRSPKAVQVQSFKEAGGYEDSRASSSFVRNRKQVSNVQAAKQKLLNEDLLEIVDMCTEQKRDPDSAFIRNVTVAPEKTVFLANNRQLNDLVRFCTKDGNVSVLGIDQTFNVGNFYVTLTNYHHLMLKKKRGSNECPVFLGPTLIHHQKTFESFLNFLPTF
eukprot:Seg3779.2 transcript_id=Seg3779.2/GoldUCD/mRNA.D3Y31 product="hypothetical protein" protein_id=Seg3779.2/GoldUCD/D3Y31